MKNSIQLGFKRRNFLLFTLLFLLLSCAPTIVENQLAEEVILYDWEGDIPQSVIDSFVAEYGVNVRYEVYESQEEATENMRNGQVYDVVVMENSFIPSLIKDGLLAELTYGNIQNFKNISPNFRGLAIDPYNTYTVPYSWGTTGLVVRSDLIQSPVQKWSDLWDERYAGKVAIWKELPRETISLTLKSLGYSANSENPSELEATLNQLLALKPHLIYLEDYDSEYAAPALASGDVLFAMGYSGDLFASQEMDLDVEYIMPDEGALLWGDNFVVPANSLNKYTAEVFINFILRPEISAEICNTNYYATDNQAAWPLIEPEILNDPAIFPGDDVLIKAEIVLPLSPEGQLLYDQIWQQFLDADPK